MVGERIFYCTVLILFGVFAVIVNGVLKDGDKQNRRYFSLAVPVEYEGLDHAEQLPSLNEGFHRNQMRPPIDTLPMGPLLPEAPKGDLTEVPDPKSARNPLLEPPVTDGDSKGWPYLMVAINHSPPRKIVDGDQISGVDDLILKDFSKRAKVNIRYKSCAFSDCLKLLRDGSADLMTGISINDERQHFLTYLHPQVPFASQISFYVKAESDFSIRSYQDLKGKRIGHLKAEEYFAQFDKDSILEKHAFPTETDLINALLVDQVDVVIGDSLRTDYLLTMGGVGKRIARAEYRVSENLPLYFLVVSKKSKFSNAVQSWEQILAQMVLEGAIESIIDRFQRKFSIATWQQPDAAGP